jgi:hypothetical protein
MVLFLHFNLLFCLSESEILIKAPLSLLRGWSVYGCTKRSVQYTTGRVSVYPCIPLKHWRGPLYGRFLQSNVECSRFHFL